MTRRGAFLLLDTSLFLGFCALMSWRLTGLPVHEWIGIALAGAILFHLFLHWGWLESRVDNARGATGTRRYRLTPLLLNVSLFMAMGTVIVSGFVISKVVLPNGLSPGAYLTWHGIHESATTLTLILVGLHIALNWDRIRTGVRHLFAASRGHRWGLAAATSLRRVVGIAVVTAILTMAVYGLGRLLPPATEVDIFFPDGHHERRPPPAELTALQPGSTQADPAGGSRRLIMSVVMLSLTAVVGRRFLRLRLSRIREDRDHTRSELGSVAGYRTS